MTKLSTPYYCTDRIVTTLELPSHQTYPNPLPLILSNHDYSKTTSPVVSASRRSYLLSPDRSSEKQGCQGLLPPTLGSLGKLQVSGVLYSCTVDLAFRNPCQVALSEPEEVQSEAAKRILYITYACLVRYQ